MNPEISEEYLKQFESEGEDAVRQKIVQQSYNQKKMSLAKDWVESRERARKEKREGSRDRRKLVGVIATVVIAVATVVGLYFMYVSNSQRLNQGKIEDGTPLHTDTLKQENIVFENISPEEILKTIWEAPLLQREDISRHYKDIYVKWDGWVAGATKYGDDTIVIYMSHNEDLMGTHIFFSVSLSEYPGLGLLKGKDPISVEAKIEQVTEYNIELIVHKLRWNHQNQ